MHGTTARIIDIPDSPALAGHKAVGALTVSRTGTALPAGFRSTVAGALQPAAEAALRRGTGRLYIGAAGDGHCGIAAVYHHLGLRMRPDLA